MEDGPYETVAGYFLAHTGKMGAEGDVLHSDDGYDMTVTKVDGRRIETIEVRKAAPLTTRRFPPNSAARAGGRRPLPIIGAARKSTS